MNIRERIANWLSPKGTTVHETVEKSHPHIRRFTIRFNKSTKVPEGSTWGMIPRQHDEHPTKPTLAGFPHHKLLVTRVEFMRELESSGIITILVFYSWVFVHPNKTTRPTVGPKGGTGTPPIPPPPHM